jgi:hypothetical protein
MLLCAVNTSWRLGGGGGGGKIYAIGSSSSMQVTTIILPVVLYWCETWSLTLREERRLRLFENRVLRGVLGLKRDEVTGEWRKLHNQELNDLYSLPNIVLVVTWRIRWPRHVARMGR